MTYAPRLRSSLEPLEARIAPALLINGANLLGGAGGPKTGEASAGGNAVTLVKVTSGEAIVWYQDGVIESISFGPNASLEITGNVVGNLVGNLTANGRLTDSDFDPSNGEDGNVLLPNNLLSLKTSPLGTERGDIANIITGGNVTGVKLAGQIHGIYAGDGVFNALSPLLNNGHVASAVNFDYNPVEPGVQSSFDFTLAKAQTDAAHNLVGLTASASVTNTSIAIAEEMRIISGSGNPNNLGPTARALPGGKIQNITIQTAFSLQLGGDANSIISYELVSGNGSSGLTGGAGGLIDHVIETTSSGRALVIAGQGGNGSAGAGGAGGSITNLDLQSNSTRYEVTAGHGGSGLPGGAGGDLRTNNFANRSPLGGIVVSADFNNDGDQDVLVIDQGSGGMVINQSVNHGTSFTPIVQYTDPITSVPVITIAPAGVTPVSATAVDLNGDGLPDIVVAYKDSDSVAGYINEGGGKFWDPTANSGAGGFSSFVTPLSFSPAKIAPLDAGGDRIAVSSNVNGKGSLYLLEKTFIQSTFNFSVSAKSNSTPVVISDLASDLHGDVFAAETSGSILRLDPTGLTDGLPFDVSDTLVHVQGGITSIDVNQDLQTGGRLLAVSTAGNSVSVFGFSTTPGQTALSPFGMLALDGKPGIAHFVQEPDSTSPDDIAVLYPLASGARLELFTPAGDSGTGGATTGAGYVLSKTLNPSQSLKNFEPFYDSDGSAGIAALSGSLGQFTASNHYGAFLDYALPFANKSLHAASGDGGNGIDFTTGSVLHTGKAGAGGAISGLNVDAHDIVLTTGQGGDSQTGGGGNGGSISNPASFVSASGLQVLPALTADEVLSVTTGNGGAPSTANLKASSGSGGSISGLNVSLSAGDIQFVTGHGGDSQGGAAGSGGSIGAITALAQDGNLNLQTGAGGAALAATGAAGNGGSVNGITFTLNLAPDVESLEKPYSATVTAGQGGAAVGGAGGAGGSLSGLILTMDGSDETFDDSGATPPEVDAHKDNTVRVDLTSGAGGNGTKGGSGGALSGLNYTSVFDQTTRFNTIIVNHVVMSLTAGDGGQGTAGNGGDGGSITLTKPISGVTYLDPDAPSDDPSNGVPLLVTAGSGGHGTVKGGAGGSVTGLVAQNSLFVDGSAIDSNHLFAATVVAGHGGNGDTSDGGKGGSVLNGLLGVQGGFLRVTAGAGGDGGTTAEALHTAKGGAGGSIGNMEIGIVSTDQQIGMEITAGAGGDGVASGGAGGALSALTLNSSQSTDALSTVLYAGAGGAASATGGVGGKGGDINGVNQLKDVNSSLNLAQAGNGGDALSGRAGAGGNILNIHTVGFIGRPSDANGPLGIFDHITEGSTTVQLPQGLFSGRGGHGSSGDPNDLNGAVTNVTARQIAAIAAAMDPQTKLFAAASRIAQIKADLIGFDADRGTGDAGDGVFNDMNGGTASPGSVTPQDGFLWSKAPLVGVVTAVSRPTFIISNT